jgi:m7GpppX diphosphatase
MGGGALNGESRVEDILTGVSEADKVLYSCSDFMIIPDMKWDLQTMSALYLVAIVRDGEIRSLRDLRERHLPMLKVIKEQAGKVVEGKWNFAKGGVRMFVHYQPSYCTCNRFLACFVDS